MSLRSQLEELLPELLPSDPAQAIKGTELIRLVRLRLGEEYSDASLRYHFSFMASEPDSEIAKVERGQGYYRRMRERDGQRAPRGLLPLFLGENEPDALNCRAKALALAVRQYDTTGRGVSCSAPVKQEPWVKPDLAVVEWPEGEWEGNALVFDKSALQRRRMIGAPMMGIRSVCVARMPGGEDGRREFFRTLATSRWAQCGELVMVGELPDDSECAALRGLAAEFGVGVLCLEIADERLGELPGAEEIFKAGDEECAALLAELTPVRLAAGRLKTLEADTGETLGGEFGALFDWLAACLERGSVEEYEFRVSCY
ncbi:MAG: hypothetical protein ACLT8E_06880 [Akkermansia sp.]